MTFRDCIRGLGVVKLKKAYDILDNIEGDELEVRQQILGKDRVMSFCSNILLYSFRFENSKWT